MENHKLHVLDLRLVNKFYCEVFFLHSFETSKHSWHIIASLKCWLNTKKGRKIIDGFHADLKLI